MRETEASHWSTGAPKREAVDEAIEEGPTAAPPPPRRRRYGEPRPRGADVALPSRRHRVAAATLPPRRRRNDAAAPRRRRRAAARAACHRGAASCTHSFPDTNPTTRARPLSWPPRPPQSIPRPPRRGAARAHVASRRGAASPPPLCPQPTPRRFRRGRALSAAPGVLSTRADPRRPGLRMLAAAN